MCRGSCSPAPTVTLGRQGRSNVAHKSGLSKRGQGSGILYAGSPSVSVVNEFTYRKALVERTVGPVCHHNLDSLSTSSATPSHP